MGGIGTGNVHLLILGTGPMEQSLREQARALRVKDRVHFLGYVEEKDKFGILKMSDIFVSTSQHEGFGLVFLEAMACGLPIVCYDHGGQTDFLKSGSTGYLIELNDRQSFLASCRDLIRDPGARKRMGAENRRRVEEFFIDRCASRYEDVFDNVIRLYRGHA
jgi:glycosyltransferase involved in cell wall biosynthesis